RRKSFLRCSSIRKAIARTCDTTVPVGAWLARDGVRPDNTTVTDESLSRASPLPQGLRIQQRCFMTTANVYQQRPTTGARAESSLHHADLASLVGKGRKNAGVTVREKKLLGHLTIRGDGHDAAFAAGVHKALGIELP